MSIPTAAAAQQRALAHALTDARGHLLAAEQAELPFYAASTIKLHVLLAALRAADGADAALDLEQLVPATRSFRGADGRAFTLEGDHLDATHPADGSQVSVRELLVRMIDRSSNEATNHVITLLGLETVDEAIESLGLPGTRVERLIGDASALERGRTNETTAADLVVTVRALAAPGAGLSEASRDLARRALAAQRIRIIAPALRDDVPIGSKSGWVPGYRHDVAVIGDPATEAAHYLAVMTSGMEESEADAAIRDRTAALLPQLAR